VKNLVSSLCSQIQLVPLRPGVRAILLALLAAMDPKEKWQTMVGALNMVTTLAECSPLTISEALNDIIPVVTQVSAPPAPASRGFSLSLSPLHLYLFFHFPPHLYR
jgi:hypothetical protein